MFLLDSVKVFCYENYKNNSFSFNYAEGDDFASAYDEDNRIHIVMTLQDNARKFTVASYDEKTDSWVKSIYVK